MGQAQLCWGSAHPAYSTGALAKLKHKTNQVFWVLYIRRKTKQ